jgi:ABC-2 type transport system permease protein
MSRLLSSEWLRFRSRRIVLVLSVIALAAVVVGCAIAAVQSTPSSPVRLAELPDVLEGVTFLTFILGLVFGASAVAASWQTGTITTILTWEPRRWRWYAARVIVVYAGVFTIVLLIVAFLSAGVWLVATLRGSTAGTDSAFWGDVLFTWLRIAAIASVASMIGGGIAAVGRHTAGALGVVFVYLAVIEGLIRGLRPRWTPWLLGENIVTFVSWQAQQVQRSAADSFTLRPGMSAVVIGVYTAIALALGFTFVRVRDVQ